MSRRAPLFAAAVALVFAVLGLATLPAAESERSDVATASSPTNAPDSSSAATSSTDAASAPASETTTTDAATTTVGSPRSFTLIASGDFLPHTSVQQQARADAAAAGASGYDFRPMLAGIRDRVTAADLAICHLETMLSPDDSQLYGYPQFLVPYELADAIADAGYDACSVASNHSLDHGTAAMTSTLDHLDRVGVRHAGGARSADEQATPSIYEVNGVKVGHLSYAYGFNGFSIPASAPWTVNQIDAAAILAEAARARAAGAEFVVVSMHWGLEYQHAPTAEQQALADQLLASPDIDLIIGHHAHVVQPVGRVGSEVVVYGMGNLLSNQQNSRRLGTQEGVLVSLEVEEQRDGGFAVASVSATPTFVETPGFRIVPTSPGSHPDVYDRVLGELGPEAVGMP